MNHNATAWTEFVDWILNRTAKEYHDVGFGYDVLYGPTSKYLITIKDEAIAAEAKLRWSEHLLTYEP
jgi:hypothetical protein